MELLLKALVLNFFPLLGAILQLNVRLDVVVFHLVRTLIELYEALAGPFTLIRLIVDLLVDPLCHWLRYVAAGALCCEQRKIILGRLC